MTSSIFSFCLDLNIWCAAFLADQRGAEGTASQSLVDIARRGHSGIVPVQLVISWGMLTRLRKVFETNWEIPRATVDPVIDAIAGYARLGPIGLSPSLTLGGAGIIPIRDAEDAHVIETALAGRAHLLVTANFGDFLTSKTHVLHPGRVALLESASAALVVAHPFTAIEWLKAEIFPDAKKIRRMYASPSRDGPSVRAPDRRWPD